MLLSKTSQKIRRPGLHDILDKLAEHIARGLSALHHTSTRSTCTGTQHERSSSPTSKKSGTRRRLETFTTDTTWKPGDAKKRNCYLIQQDEIIASETCQDGRHNLPPYNGTISHTAADRHTAARGSGRKITISS